MFIIAINGESPLTVSFTKELIQIAKLSKSKLLRIDLAKRGKAQRVTPLSINCAMFDQLPKLSPKKIEKL